MRSIFSILAIILFTGNVLLAQSIVKEGMASYYSDKFQGKKTASGELYHKDSLTAAHPTLPFGTRIKVTLVKSNKSVIVRVNDRGPHSKKRVIDLSRAAANRIGLIQAGIGKVSLEVLKK